MNGNWSEQEMTSQLGASTTQAALALTAFWAMVTIGRVLFAVIDRWLPARVVLRLLPLLLVATFLLTAVLPDESPWLGLAVFGLAGLGCSALLPLTISLGQSALTSMSAAVAGGVIAFYQVGYGIAAFGVGPLVDHGTSLSTSTAGPPQPPPSMALLSFAIAGGQPSSKPASRPVPDSALQRSRTPVMNEPDRRPPSGHQYVIAHGNMRAQIAQVGATLRTFTVNGMDVIDGFRSR